MVRIIFSLCRLGTAVLLLCGAAVSTSVADISLDVPATNFSEDKELFPDRISRAFGGEFQIWKWTRTTANTELFNSTSGVAAERQGLEKPSQNWQIVLKSFGVAMNTPKSLEIDVTHLHGPHKIDKDPGFVNGVVFPPFDRAITLVGAQQVRHETTEEKNPHFDFLHWKIEATAPAIDKPNQGNVKISLNGQHFPGPQPFFWSFQPAKPGTLVVEGTYPCNPFAKDADKECMERQFRRTYSREDIVNRVKDFDRVEPNKRTKQAPDGYRIVFNDPGTVSDTTLAFLSGVPGNFAKLDLSMATQLFARFDEFDVPCLINANGSQHLFVAVDLTQWLSNHVTFSQGDVLSIVNGRTDALPGLLVSTSPIMITADAGFAPTIPLSEFTGQAKIVATIDGQVPGLRVIKVSVFTECQGTACASTTVGGGAPYTGLVGSFQSPDIQFATTTGFNWHPFGQSTFGAQMTGFLQVETSGTYPFTLTSDDGGLLFIDGDLVVDNPGPHPPMTTSNSVFLTAGTHPFEVQFFECCSGPSGINLDLPSGVAYGFTGTPGKENCLGQSVSALALQFGGMDAAATALGFSRVDQLRETIRTFCQE